MQVCDSSIWDLGFGIWDLGFGILGSGNWAIGELSHKWIDLCHSNPKSAIPNPKFKMWCGLCSGNTGREFYGRFTVGNAEMIGKRQLFLVGDCASGQISPLTYSLALELFSPYAGSRTSWLRVRSRSSHSASNRSLPANLDSRSLIFQFPG